MIFIGDIELGYSKLGGLGVFATKDIKNGALIEQGIMTVLTNVDGHENPMLFTWSDDRTKWAIGTGYLHFYNHDNLQYTNIKKVGDLKNNKLYVYATKNIRKGDELKSVYFSKEWRKCFSNF
tara:strand:- start:184 stop:549 length:366 start_codon:yes stop_codon:yes gene_type:complete